MQTKYKLKQLYPGIPKDWEEGTILFPYAPTVGFVYYSDMYDKFRIEKYIVENNPKFFEKI